MNEQTIQQALTERAVGFHRVLAAAGLYHTPLGEADFLKRVREQIAEDTQDVLHGRAGLELTVLGLPVTIMYSLLDVLPVASFDYEFGYEHLFSELATLFRSTPFSFAWSYNQREHTASYRLDAQTWTLVDIDLDDEVDLRYPEIEQHLAAYLGQHGRQLYAPVTGDQTVMLLLVPAAAVDALGDYLIANDDPRASEFY